MALLRKLAGGNVFNNVCRGFHSSGGLYENIGVVGIPLAKGQRQAGVDRGPDDLRDFGTVRALTKYGWNVTGEPRNESRVGRPGALPVFASDVRQGPAFVRASG